jgi:5-methylcytosine-specific restriction enzyme subunit McrC
VKIPIQNVYYLLCYAWKHVEDRDLVDVAELEEFENVQDLLGTVLAEGTFRLLRLGLDRGYREKAEDLAGIRGKLAVSEMATRALRARGRAACIFEDLSHDVIHNRILRSTLEALLRLDSLDGAVRARAGLAFRRLEGIRPIRVDRQAFRRVQLDRNRRTYRFLMSVCELLHASLLMSEDSGGVQFRDFRRDEARMWKLFEDFVVEFYCREQGSYRVKSQGQIPWHDAWATSDADRMRIPAMHADVLLDGPDRRIVLDAKFYEQAFDGRFGSKLRSGHLYQVLSYLRNRQAAEPEGPRHEGVLLYPVVDEPFAVDVGLEGFRIQARGIALGQPWQRIHEDLLAVIT